jgi:hypothetical protein
MVTFLTACAPTYKMLRGTLSIAEDPMASQTCDL